MLQRYEFYSELSPEQLSGALSEKLTAFGQKGKTGVDFCVKWKGCRFVISRTESRGYTAEDGWVPRISGAGRTRGMRMDWHFGDPFCGRVYAGGQGGSILRGQFRMHPLGKFLFAVFPLIGACSFLFFSPRSVKTQVLEAIAAVWYLRILIRVSRNTGTDEGSRQILQILRENFEEIEE